MRYQPFIFSALLSIALPLFTSAEHHGPSSRRHNSLANRKRTEMELQEFHKRDNNARMTFYDVGLGACGKTNIPSDFIVALNSCEYGGGSPGPQCFKMITIEYQGKTTQAQIMDECPGCPCGGLDMSTGLFDFFADASVGVFYANWWYDGSGPPAPAPSSSKKPTPTSTWSPPPTSSSSKWVDPSPWTSQTTSTWTSSSSTKSQSSSWPSASWNSTTWSSHSSTSTSISYSPGATAVVPSTAENLKGVNMLLGQLGNLVVQYGS